MVRRATSRPAATAADAAAQASRAAAEAETAAREAEAALARALAEDESHVADDGSEDAEEPVRRTRKRPRRALAGAVVSAVAVVALASTSVGLSHSHTARQAAADQDLELLQGTRQAVINLITPSAADPAGSAQRILDGATGEWKTEFESTKTEFIDTIAQSKTESTGEILGAGIERAHDDGTTSVMVSAVTKVTNAAGAKDEPRTWRLRVQVGKDGDLYKLAKIEVVP
ncbi:MULTISPECIES: hypothetical protein [unclassified Rhodococcus (in: high G+C Gram-positive bacteria)]|uniref:hypothetical protein n=1 Tax=unclassified Rhodococcus (in: high G+C Gram-positive bacteria) TaxID=192944 RepID=UPI00163B3AB1|nr:MULTISPECIES: hypothetical protein [unclassified Rhodococcus (in: high G+C Gram-positive bacteria)]MBC2637714.1 hypothetical protein [Rhodococcus sp. 3A]MBC2897542.1 hypothetical protein [Rhodococcus sp. 4CII]